MKAWPRPPIRATFPRPAAVPIPKLESCPCGVSAGPLFHRERGSAAYAGVLKCAACGLAAGVKAGQQHLLAQHWNDAVAAKRAANEATPSTMKATDHERRASDSDHR